MPSGISEDLPENYKYNNALTRAWQVRAGAHRDRT
jgi:hypothetical protein